MKKEDFGRREFLRKGLASAAVSQLALHRSRPLFAQKPALKTRSLASGERFKLGIIGCGSRSRRHINAINRIPKLEVAALCDLAPSMMAEKRALIQRGDPKTYTSLEELVVQDDLDGIIVVLPNYLHKEATVAALEAGKHVLCEKPMALNVADCNAMIAAAERHQKALQIGTQRRHSSTFQEALGTIRKSPLGRILYSDVNSYRGDWAVKSPDPQEDERINWRLSQKKSGGIAYEQGAHTVDLNNWIIDSEPVEVCGMMGTNNLSLRRRTSADYAAFIVRFSSGAVSNFGGVVYNYGEAVPDRYFATHGAVSLTARRLEIRFGQPRGVPSAGEPPGPLTIDLAPRDGTERQMEHFVNVMQGDAAPFPDGYDGRRTIMIVRGAEISSLESRTVKCADVG